MAFKLFDRVKETSTTTGTGTYTLAGAVTGFKTFTSVLSNSDTTIYCATDGTNWEIGFGTFTTSGTTLARTAILASSNAGSAVNWAAGTREIFIVLNSSRLAFFHADPSFAALAANSVTAGCGGVAVGTNNTVNTATTPDYGFAMGRSNNVSGAESGAIGSSNTVSAVKAVAIGESNTINGSATNSVAIGKSNTVSSSVLAAIAAGQDTLAAQSYSMALGRQSKSYAGGLSISGGMFNNYGDRQVSIVPCVQTTTSATTAQLDSAVSGTALTLTANRIYMIKGHVVARQYGGASGTIGDSKIWEITGVFKVGASTKAILGSTTVTTVANDAAAAAWTVVFNTGTSLTALIDVTGEANKNIVWLGTLYITEAGG